MASTIAAITTGVGGVVTTADATGNLSLLSGATTVVAVTSTGAAVTGTLSASGVSTFAAGTALLPALTTTGDTNTGVWFPAADTIAASTGGTERMRIDSSGNVGIGTASPAYKLHSATTIGTGSTGNNGFVGFKRSSDGVEIGSMNTDGTNVVVNTGAALAFQTSGTERMRLDSSGAVLVADTATAAYFDGNLNVVKAGNIAFCAKVTGNVNAAPIAVTNTATSGNNAFVTFQTETTPAVRGTISYNRSAGLTAYNTTSDQRLKDNIVDASSALSKIDSVKIRSFNWKETGNHVDFGVIAQELISIAPECVTEGQDNDDGTIKTSWAVDTSALVPALVKAIQEQQTIINDLKARITALEAK